MSSSGDNFLIESQMRFGPYTVDSLFKIENSRLHRSLGDGYKIVELIAINDVTAKEHKLIN